MPASPSPIRHARCACGRVQLELRGAPILVSACYCEDCRQAAGQIEASPGAKPIATPDGGTPCVLFRKDRVAAARGEEHLRDHRLAPDAPTRRVIAGCCNTALYLDFAKGHWLSVYRANLVEDAPPLQMRVQTRTAGRIPDTDHVPAYPGYPLTFMARLVAARVAMLFSR